MTTLAIHNLGKKYTGWVFRNLEAQFTAGDRVAVTGYNGSGKSTFLRLLAGMATPDEGSVVLSGDGAVVPADGFYRHVTFAAPYIDLIEEFTARELLHFFSAFKKPADGPADRLLAFSGLDGHAGMPVRDLSSGMKQRLKLVLALCFESRVVLLDEPGTNLDEAGLAWMRGLVEKQSTGRILFIASNDPGREAANCSRTLCLEDYKPARG